MKLFIYKTLIIFFFIFLTYHLTAGYQLRQLEIKMINYFDKEKISYLREKIKKEIKNSLVKDKILKTEDAELINKFIFKLSNEINLK